MRLLYPLVSPRLLVSICFGCGIVAIFPSAVLGRTYALVVGHNVGHRDEDPLKYAEQDAERFLDLVTTLGEVDKKDAFLLIAPTKKQVDETMSLLHRTLGNEADKGRSATVMFFFAGHGDKEYLHLAEENIPRDTLIKQLETLSARVTIAILDACQTPVVARKRGVRSGPGFAFNITSRSSPEGVVVIQSSQTGQPALESDTLGGSLFSHYWFSALRGAADFDADGVVTLHEAYLFTSRQTLFYSSTASGTIQQPSFEIDLKGSNDLVLTRPAKASAKLVFDDDQAASYLIFSQPSGAFVAEVYPSSGAPLQVAVPPGRLLVQRRFGAELRVAQIETSFGGRYRLRPEDFVERPYEELARRGGKYSLYPHRLRLQYGVRGDFLRNIWILRHGPELEYLYEFDYWAIKSELGILFSSYRQDLFSSDEIAADFLFGLQWQYPLEAVVLSVGFGPIFQWIYQQRQRVDADRLENAGIDGGATDSSTLSPGVYVEIGWTASLSRSFYVSNVIRGAMYGVRLEKDMETSWSAAFGLGGGLGVGYRF